jgi:GntR family transcriptional regulator, transcriptional repressor for pyruvate dehydrogenase complex
VNAADPAWALPPDTRRPLPEVIEDKIERMIDAGELSWGQQLPNENELARRLHVGRSSVRTALQRLQMRGLVEVARGRGWTVAATPPSALEDVGDDQVAEHNEMVKLSEVRAAIEATATRIAAREATDLELNAISDAHDAHRAAGTRADVDELMRTDEAFHSAIVAAAHMPLLTHIYNEVVPHVRPLRLAKFTDQPSTARESADGHALVLSFLRRRDAGAGTAMEIHVRNFAPAPTLVGGPDQRGGRGRGAR